MRLPTIAFLAALFLFPLYPKIGLIRVEGTYIPIRIDDLMVAVVAIVWAASLVYARRRPVVPQAVALLAAGWIVCGFAALLIGTFLLDTVTLATGLAYWLKPLEYLLLGLIAYDLVRAGSLTPRVVLLVVFASAALVVTYGILERFGIAPQAPGSSPIPDNIFSTIGDPHQLATYLGVIVLLGVGIWHTLSGAWRTVLLVGLVGGALVMFWTAARTEWVAVVVCLLAMAVWRPARRPAVLMASVFVVITFVGPLAQLAGPIAQLPPVSSPTPATPAPEASAPPTPTEAPAANNDVSNRLVDEGFLQTIEWRLRIKWPALLEIGMRNPLLGAGPSAATEAADGYYVRSFVEVGIVGTLFFVGLIVAVVRRAWHARRLPDPMAGSLARAFVVSSAFLAIVALLIDSWVASRVMELYWPLAGAVLGAAALAAPSAASR